MAIETTYTHARANLASLIREVAENRETVVIKKRGSERVALVSASELDGLLETAHLLRSPRNAERLLRAMRRARRGEPAPESLAELREKLGLGETT